MNRKKKKILGILGLLMVAGLTMSALAIQNTDVGAVSSIAEKIVVRVFDSLPNINIKDPNNEQVVVGETHTVEYDWQNSIYADFTLSKDGEVIATWHEDYGEFTPGEHPYGTGSHEIILSEYGEYIVTAISTGSNSTTHADSITIYRLTTDIEKNRENEDRDPIFDITFDEKVDILEIYVYDENGEKIFDDPIIVDVTDEKTGAEKETIEFLLEMPEGAEDGKYQIEVHGKDSTGFENSDPSSTYFNYISPTPDNPDTGFFTGELNIARSDFLITGLMIFFGSTVGALFVLFKKEKR